jgi:hypothetical protein
MQFEKSQETVAKEILSVRNAAAQRTFHKYGGLYVRVRLPLMQFLHRLVVRGLVSGVGLLLIQFLHSSTWLVTGNME